MRTARPLAVLFEWSAVHSDVVGQVGLEPTVYLTSRFYRPLQSPTMHTDPYDGAGRVQTGTGNARPLAVLFEWTALHSDVEMRAGFEPAK